MIPPIPQGDFYDCRDAENLQYDTPEEALEYYFDGWASPGCDMTEVIQKYTPVELRVYEQTSLDPKWVGRQAERALDLLEESFDEEYGNPEDYKEDGWIDAKKECLPALLEVFKKFLSYRDVQRCDEIASVSLDASQVEELLKD
jgi:hypothetical protein